MYMYAHPGKKLNFMGNEIGQIREWDEKRQQDWELVKYPIHDAFARFMKDLNHIYLQEEALSQYDYEKYGFCWIDCHQENKCIYAFERTGDSDRIIAVFNFSDKVQEYELKVKNAKGLVRLISSDHEIYDGNKAYPHLEYIKVKSETVRLDLSAFSGVYFKVI